MNDAEAFDFIRTYFHRLFVDRDLSALDVYLHPDYWDDDIGDPAVNHREDARRYLTELFARHPRMGVIVERAVCQGEVITAYLAWHEGLAVLRSGVALFVVRGGRILKRHTFIHEEAPGGVP